MSETRRILHLVRDSDDARPRNDSVSRVRPGEERHQASSHLQGPTRSRAQGARDEQGWQPPVQEGADTAKPTYPARLVLAFRSAEERDAFLGQLSDGWGEEYVEIDWKADVGPKGEGGPVRAYAVDTFADTEDFDDPRLY